MKINIDFKDVKHIQYHEASQTYSIEFYGGMVFYIPDEYIENINDIILQKRGD